MAGRVNMQLHACSLLLYLCPPLACIAFVFMDEIIDDWILDQPSPFPLHFKAERSTI